MTLLTEKIFNDFIRHSIGFERIILNTTDRLSHSQYPPYDIEKLNDSKYIIKIALAGFKKEELEIRQNDRTLTILGKGNKDKDNSMVYNGIAKRNFVRSFTLSEYAEVSSIDLKDGILSLIIEISLPEEMKPKVLEIN